MTSLIWVILLIGMSSAVEQQSFRSILIERACVKRPELDFCGASSQSIASSVVPLVVPPMTTTTPTTTTTTTTEAPTTTPSKPSGTTDSVDFDEEAEGNSTSSTSEHEKLGSLVKLPKPEKSSTEKVVDQVIEHSGVATSDEPLKSKNSTVQEVKIEDEKGVLVFVSEYCVVERERFVRGCHGDIDKKEETFCKTYVAACASTTGVLPVMTYCARYYTYYPTHCKAQLVEHNALQFCFAFEQFCLPEKTAAQAKSSQKPKSSLRKCEDVLPEARKVCNPFPNPRDTFNLLRCTHFLTNCKKFVDWL